MGGKAQWKIRTLAFTDTARGIPREVVPMRSEALIEVLTEVAHADHFDQRLNERVPRTLGQVKEPHNLLTFIANILEEYYNYHKPAIATSQAEDEREELKPYIEVFASRNH